MFHHILIPLDGSSRAEQVLPVAAQLARASHGVITLLQVVDLAHEALAYCGWGASFVPPNIVDMDLTSATDYLNEVRQRATLEGVTVHTKAVSGNPADVIVTLAAELPVDLIVISSHGYTRVKRWIMGSVAEKVARHSSVPVLMLRDGEPLHTHHDPEGCAFVRALVPLDTSPRSQDVLAPAAEIISLLSAPDQGELHLAQMILTPHAASEVELEEATQGAEQNLAEISQHIRDGLVAQFGPELHPKLSWSALSTGDVAEGIVHLAEHGDTQTVAGKAMKYDLIAMTTHGARGIHRWAVGSITERVLHTTRLPLLIVRPADMLRQEHQQHESPDHVTV